MTEKPPRRVPEEAAATSGEIAKAIEALTPGNLTRLKCFADIHALKLGRKAESKDGDDLLQTALLSVLDGTRRWNKSKVGFVQFLEGAIRSISSNWARSYKRENAPALATDLQRENKEGEVFNPLENAQEHAPNPDKQLSNRQILEQIEKFFSDDERAQMVLEAWQEGYDHSGVRELWGLSQNEYNTIVRRIRRRLETAGITPD